MPTRLGLDDTRWVAVAWHLGRPMAEVDRSILEGAGLRARVTGDDAGGVANHFAFLGGGICVEVPADQQEQAREVLGSEPVDGADDHEPAVPSFASLVAVSIGRLLLAGVLVGFVVVTLRRLM